MSHTTLDGGYTYSFSGSGLSSPMALTCGLALITKTIQVTETIVSTIYIYSSATFSNSEDTSTSTPRFPFPSDGDSGGRPAPPRRTNTITVGSSGTASGWGLTATLITNSTVSQTSLGAGVDSTAGMNTIISSNSEISSDSIVARPPRPTTIVLNASTTTVTDAPLPAPSRTLITSTTSILTDTGTDGASTWTLSGMSSSSADSTNETTVTSSPQAPPAATTITSGTGGVGSTWIITMGTTSRIEPFPISTSTTQFFTPSEAASEVLRVVTSFLGGVRSTWTVIGGSTVTGSLSSMTSASSEAPSQTVTGGFTIITSVIEGVESTWTVIRGSTVTLQPSGMTGVQTSSPTPSETATIPFSIITSVIGGVGSTWTAVGASTIISSLNGSARTLTPSIVPSETASGVMSVITNITQSLGSTWTVIGGSILVSSSNSSTAAIASSSSETVSSAFSVIASTIGGVASTWTLIEGSTLLRPSASTFSPSASTSLITTETGGVASSWTAVEGSTVSDIFNGTMPTLTQSAAVSVITSVFDGVGSTWTANRGSTFIGLSDISYSAILTLPPGASVVTSTIDGIASSWTIIRGSTIFGTASISTVNSAETERATVITSIVGGVASSWTEIGGSTIFGSANSMAEISTVSATPKVFTSDINGVVSTWTVVGGSTVFDTLTQRSMSTRSPTASAATVGGSVIPSWSISAGTTVVNTLNGSIPTRIGSASGAALSSYSSATTHSSATPTLGYDSAFTGISIVVAQNGSTCYALPIPTASLHESLLDNTGREPPYIDAFYLDANNNSVKYLRLRDNNTDPSLIDVSDPSRLAIIDKDGDIISIDSEGLHFTSANCSPKIDVFISGFFEQLSTLTNTSCGDINSISANDTGTPVSLPVSKGTLDGRQERTFDVVLDLTDQCDDPVRADLPVSVFLGDTECVVLPKSAGQFVANCAFPGGESTSMECETSVQQTLDHLTQGSFAGTCPPFTSVWSLFSQGLSSVVNVDALLKPFLDAGLDLGTDLGRGILSVIDSYIVVYDFSTLTFRNSTSEGGSSLGYMMEEYGVTAIRKDACRSLLFSETLNLTFTTGMSMKPVPLAKISTVPSPPPEYERNVTDPLSFACCPNPSKCIAKDGEEGYPPEAAVTGSDCLCGTTLEGRGIGFRTGRCLGYNQCNATSPCAKGALLWVCCLCKWNGVFFAKAWEMMSEFVCDGNIWWHALMLKFFNHNMSEVQPAATAVPMELQLMIMRELADTHGLPISQSRGITFYACVSKVWQTLFDSLTFKNLIIRPSDLSPFRCFTRNSGRQSLVRHFWLRIEKPLSQEQEDLRVIRFLFNLWTTLSTWPARALGQGLTLELSSHTYVGLVKYVKYAPPDDQGLYSKHLETGSLEAYDGFQKFAPHAAIHAGATTNLFTWGNIEFRTIELPRVEAVIKLLTRRVDTRNIKAKGLSQIIESLSRLEEIHMEIWGIGQALQERSWLKVSYPRNSLLFYLQALLIIFDTVYQHRSRNLPCSTRRFARLIPRITYHGEPPGMKAVHFFHHLLGGAVENRSADSDKQSYQESLEFRELTSLTLTSGCFSLLGDTSQERLIWHKDVENLLLMAAEAVTRMPKLQLMEVWNGRDGQASIFHYKISWSSTEEIEVLGWDVFQAWEKTVSLHERRELRAEVVRLSHGSFEYYGSTLPYLYSREDTMNPVPAAQII
ncbi:hypothetical protein CSPAE12_11718 [Colletotrichum incanum]|nr:hypothetical protein CSPAE12_11718 [Colletotrichum incanum]